jgi:hypothetical protein
MRKLHNIFEHHLSTSITNLALGRQQMVEDIMGNADVLEELEDRSEVWFQIDLQQLACHLNTIAINAKMNTYERIVATDKAQKAIGELVAKVFTDAAISYIDVLFSGVDLAELRRELARPSEGPQGDRS